MVPALGTRRSNCKLVKYDPVTGIATGTSYWVSGSSDGGLDIDVDLVPGKIVAISLVQGTPDSVIVIEIGDYSSGGGTFPEVLYYTFDEAGSDSTENFAVPGRGWDWGQVLGALTLGDTGQFGSALVASGNSGATDYVNTGWATDIGTSSWTISLWLNNSTTDFGYVFGDVNASAWRCFINGAAGASNIILRGGGMADHIVAGVVPGPSVIHWVYDAVAGETRAYLNGVFVDAVVQSPLNITGSGPFKVGGYTTGLTVGTLIDEFRFYDRALDSAEVATTWNITIIPVELTSFTASVNDNDVNLNWVTASEIKQQRFPGREKIKRRI